jgi:predicted ATP-grasp superfamily ATP-dependent carboligase
MFADERRMTSVLEKARTYAAAAKVGVPTPRTVQIERLDQAEALSTQLRYPVVLKWSNPLTAGELLKPFGLAPDKARYCHSARDLLDYLRQFEPTRTYPLIQEYCAGYGLGQFFLMKDGRAHFAFQHRRVHEWPPEGGFSSVCESVPPDLHQDLMDKSIALLRELEWEGVAMVEYCHDPSTGEFALMEVNGRFWGSLPLAYHAGANFPLLCYRLFGLGEPVAPPPYRVGIRCRYMVPETKRLLRILFAQRKIPVHKVKFSRLPALLIYLADFVRPRSHYYVFDPRDPKPFFSDLKQMAMSMLSIRSLRRSSRSAPGRLHKKIAKGG